MKLRSTIRKLDSKNHESETNIKLQKKTTESFAQKIGLIGLFLVLHKFSCETSSGITPSKGHPWNAIPLNHPCYLLGILLGGCVGIRFFCLTSSQNESRIFMVLLHPPNKNDSQT